MKANRLLLLIAVTQVLTGIRVIRRLIRTAGGDRITPIEGKVSSASYPVRGERVTVIVPVLNERDRLSPCLEGLIAQRSEVVEIVVVDGGLDDGTQQLVSTYAQRDTRVCLMDASPIPTDWNRKSWGLQVGLCAASPVTDWILTVDADVRLSAASTTYAFPAHCTHAKQLAYNT